MDPEEAAAAREVGDDDGARGIGQAERPDRLQRRVLGRLDHGPAQAMRRQKLAGLAGQRLRTLLDVLEHRGLKARFESMLTSRGVVWSNG